MSYLNIETTTIQRVISLGNWCSTKANINLFFHPENEWSKSAPGMGDIFDWMCMVDYDYLALLLQNNLSDIFEKEDLIITDNVVTNTGRAVLVNAIYNSKYRMIWPHLFDNISDFNLHAHIQSIYDPNSDVLTQIQSKMDYLKNKFISAKEKNTLYIITYDEHEHIPAIIRPQKPSLETIVKVRNALAQIRGNNNFFLLVIMKEFSFTVFENIIFDCNKDSHSFYNGKTSSTVKSVLSKFQFDLSG